MISKCKKQQSSLSEGSNFSIWKNHIEEKIGKNVDLNNKDLAKTIPINPNNITLDTVILSLEISIKDYGRAKQIARDMQDDIKGIIGLSHIKVKTLYKDGTERCYVQFEMSAKSLTTNYFYGINIKTYNEFKNYFKIFAKQFKDVDSITDDDIKVIALHVKNDYPTENSAALLEDFTCITNYNSAVYTRDVHNSNGLTFKNKVNSKVLRFQFTIYNKAKEYLRANNNQLRGFFEDFGVDVTTQLIRFELKLMSLGLINYYIFDAKDKYDTTVYSLKEILEYKPKVNPVYKVFKDIFPYLEFDSVDFSPNWIPIMQEYGPNKFLKTLGIATFPILCGDDRNTCESIYKQVYARQSSISKAKRTDLTKSIPVVKTLSNEGYRNLSMDLIKRISLQLGLPPKISLNRFESVENYLKNNCNDIEKYLYKRTLHN